ncbi:MAG: hypothetical protein FWD67_04840 [Betaproteobacteria bacterium]|nr:hypothetical protein [Betaproteobacteria bacterium]
MTQLVLVVPGLIWPAPQILHPVDDIPHPALAQLLGRGQQCMQAAVSYEHLLAQLLGMECHHRPFPLAALRCLGEESEDAQSGAHWLCADPVNLSFMGVHMLLDEFGRDEISAEEAAALVTTLNDEFGSLGHFSAATPTRWYLRMKRPVKTQFFPLDEAVCRPIQDFLPTEGEGGEDDAKHWRHILNEIQVTFHNHPVNTAREAAGQRPINSLWFWGNGAQPTFIMPDAALPAVQASDPVARGLARAAEIEPEAPDVARALQADTLAVLDTLASPARHLDSARWQDAFAALEQNWFTPISKAFGNGALRHLALHVPGERAGFSLTLGSGARWCFWRSPLLLGAVRYP